MKRNKELTTKYFWGLTSTHKLPSRAIKAWRKESNWPDNLTRLFWVHFDPPQLNMAVTSKHLNHVSTLLLSKYSLHGQTSVENQTNTVNWGLPTNFTQYTMMTSAFVSNYSFGNRIAQYDTMITSACKEMTSANSVRKSEWVSEFIEQWYYTYKDLIYMRNFICMKIHCNIWYSKCKFILNVLHSVHLIFVACKLLVISYIVQFLHDVL